MLHHARCQWRLDRWAALMICAIAAEVKSTAFEVLMKWALQQIAQGQSEEEEEQEQRAAAQLAGGAVVPTVGVVSSSMVTPN